MLTGRSEADWHELRRQGYPTALTTMSHRHHVRRSLSVLALSDAFDLVVPGTTSDAASPTRR